MSNRKFLLSSILFINAMMLSTSASADWSVPGLAWDNQNIVVVISENPVSNPERTCLAVTLAKVLSKNEYRPQNITIFATLNGSALGLKSKINLPRFKCAQPDGSEISLWKNLEQFLSDNPDNLVLCPLCFMSRYGTEHDYGVLPGVDASPTAVIDIFANADKILDF